jgi:3-carboxy-cis,cis-muconate cycloisomerase
MSLYSALFHSGEVTRIFSEKNTLAQMLHTEAALAKAQAGAGLFPEKYARAIAQCCRVDLLHVEKLKADILLGGNAAIPLVRQLGETVKNRHPEAAGFVHFGATSQDVVDTATVLQIRQFLVWLEPKLDVLEKNLLRLTRKHRNTVMVGRTLLQQARPLTFGLKTAGWLESLSRSRARLQEMKKRVLVVQLAGAVGSGNAHITSAVQSRFARILGLKTANSWHTQRDNLAEYASTLGILTGSLGKIAKDVSLLMQTEIAEVLEGAAAGKGASSAMPHKRNPVTCAAILANAQRTPFLVAGILGAMPQENERAAGLWHSEWEVLAEITTLCGGALEQSIGLLENLEVDAKRMSDNLERTQGLIFAESIAQALAPEMGKTAAHDWVERACRTAMQEQRHLKTVLLDMQVNLSNSELDALFNAENSLGNSLEIIDAILQRYATQP